jgi:type VI secretion system secreted protein VgrG
MEISQEGRHLVLETPLGEDQLVLTALSGSEHVNGLFEFHLEAMSPEENIDPKKLLGKPVTFSVHSHEGEKRWFSGICNRFMGAAGQSRQIRNYRLEVVPEHWLLTQRHNCKIFQNKSVPDIIRQVLSDAGVAAYHAVGLGNHPEHEYCVQYDESDFAFISRLMEEEGIFYFYKHSHGEHQLILTDAASTFHTIELPEIEIRHISAEAMGLVDAVNSWERHERFIPQKWAHTDYNFETPSTDLNTKIDSVVKLERGGPWEIFEWRGDYLDKSRGDELAKLRMEAQEAGYTVVEGSGFCRFFTAGGKFAISRHDASPERGQTWVCASVHHLATDMTHLPNEREATSYSNTFVCVPDKTPLRPQRKTPRPYIRGPQTAVVTGPNGEEIYTDKYGRIRVQFFWDRYGKKDENSSCWIRVAHNWAGKNWGVIFTPRIGMEVLVDFIDGNPDHPLITGCVYNAEYMPPWALPGNKTQSGLQTRSSTGGGSDDFNELRFEDKKGSEEVYFHGQKDFNRVVEHDDTEKIGNDQTNEIKNDRTTTVQQGNEKLTVSQGNRDVVVSMGNDSHDVKMGNISVKADLGAITIEAMQSITLKVGMSSVTLDQSGVKISGMLLQNEGQAMSTTKAPMIIINADGMLTLHGGIMMIG